MTPRELLHSIEDPLFFQISCKIEPFHWMGSSNRIIAFMTTGKYKRTTDIGANLKSETGSRSFPHALFCCVDMREHTSWKKVGTKDKSKYWWTLQKNAYSSWRLQTHFYSACRRLRDLLHRSRISAAPLKFLRQPTIYASILMNAAAHICIDFLIYADWPGA